MWNGKWSKELDKLYTAYIDLFDSEPDLDMETAGKGNPLCFFLFRSAGHITIPPFSPVP